MIEKKVDFMIVGAGIIGLTIAYELNYREKNVKILIVEKETDVAFHSSGRNSGVLHAGFYYTADSLKAKFTKDGNRLMKEYCKTKNIKINEVQKVVVTKDETELAALFELEKRGVANGVDVQIINEEELSKIDPNAKTYRYALYSPTTATVDPVEICKNLKKDLLEKGIEFIFDFQYSKMEKTGNNENDISFLIKNGKRRIKAKRIINASGLYADKIAQKFGFGKEYTIIPFKGIYLKGEGDSSIKTNIYPVPNLKNPFLGVHFTITVDNISKIGPTSIPTFWRENYKGFDNFKIFEIFPILLWEANLFLRNSFGFRTLAIEEMKKYNMHYFCSLASNLVKTFQSVKYDHWSKPGIRAQLLHKKSKKLVMDFVVEGDRYSTHILNAVSPAFTCSFAFSRWVIDKYILNENYNNTKIK